MLTDKPEINILLFFQTGTINGVKLGFSRQEIEACLGEPDESYPNLWIYGGLEFYFSHNNENLLEQISFKPFYLFRMPSKSKEKTTKVRRWIFRSRKGPTQPELVKGLLRYTIPYQDTGLEMLIWDEEIKNCRVIEYDESLLQKSWWGEGSNECFGTLVLRNGLQIRYNETGEILRVSLGDDWMYKGKEATITWPD